MPSSCARLTLNCSSTFGIATIAPRTLPMWGGRALNLQLGFSIRPPLIVHFYKGCRMLHRAVVRLASLRRICRGDLSWWDVRYLHGQLPERTASGVPSMLARMCSMVQHAGGGSGKLFFFPRICFCHVWKGYFFFLASQQSVYGGYCTDSPPGARKIVAGGRREPRRAETSWGNVFPMPVCAAERGSQTIPLRFRPAICRRFREVTSQQRVSEVKGPLIQEASGTGGTEEDGKVSQRAGSQSDVEVMLNSFQHRKTRKRLPRFCISRCCFFAMQLHFHYMLSVLNCFSFPHFIVHDGGSTNFKSHPHFVCRLFFVKTY